MPLDVEKADDDRVSLLERDTSPHLAGRIRDAAARITASGIVAPTQDGPRLGNARQFAAVPGFVSGQNSAAGMSPTKWGEGCIRGLPAVSN